MSRLTHSSILDSMLVGYSIERPGWSNPRGIQYHTARPSTDDDCIDRTEHRHDDRVRLRRVEPFLRIKSGSLLLCWDIDKKAIVEVLKLIRRYPRSACRRNAHIWHHVGAIFSKSSKACVMGMKAGPTPMSPPILEKNTNCSSLLPSAAAQIWTVASWKEVDAEFDRRWDG